MNGGTTVWLSMLLLGAWHGLNPGMGWLFAVALGMQEGSGRAVWRALPPLALGHALAVGAAVLVAILMGIVVSPGALRWIVASVLLAFGIYKFIASRHPRYGGMRVSPRDLVVWSGLMASAHGAGLMVVPFLLGRATSVHPHHAVSAEGLGHIPAIEATMLHTLSYLCVTGLVAILVYRRLGLRLLRTHWINLDLVWAAALVLTATITPFL